MTQRRQLPDFMTVEGITEMHQSWLAWSAGTLPFLPGDKLRLLLGIRDMPPESIPEVGDVCLHGGFNTYVPAPAMWETAADAWLLANLGLQLDPAQCTDFLPVQYDMATITAPLKTSVGPLNIKRVAFQRMAGLTEAQAASIQPKGRLKGVFAVTRDEFEALVGEGQRASFPHQIAQTRDAFDIAERVGVANIGKLRATWALAT